MPTDFWPLLIANLPIVAALFWALNKRWIVMGETFSRELDNKDREIAFREQLRQEAIKDVSLLEDKDREKTEALRALTDVVKQTLELNDRLLNDTLDQRWDGNDRRVSKTPARTRRST